MSSGGEDFAEVEQALGVENAQEASRWSGATCRDIVREVKKTLLLTAEGIITLIQVLYVFVLTGEFTRAFRAVRDTFALNSTDSGGLNSTSDVNSLRIFLAVPSFPETFVVNVTIYSCGMTALLILSVAVWELFNIWPDRYRCIRDRLPRAIGTILAFIVVALCITYLSHAVSDIDGFFVDAVVLLVASILVFMFACILCFWGNVLVTDLAENLDANLLLEYETVSIQALFQVYDLVKDGIFLSLGVQTVDLVAFGLTVVDVALSVIMLAELYTESDSKFSLGVYLTTLLQYASYTILLLFAPPYWLLISLFGLSLLVYGASQCLPRCRGWPPTWDLRLILLSSLIGFGSQENNDDRK